MCLTVMQALPCSPKNSSIICQPLRAKAVELATARRYGRYSGVPEIRRNRQVDCGEQHLPVMSHERATLAIQAETYAVQPSVSPQNTSCNPKLNTRKSGGFTQTDAATAYNVIVILCDGNRWLGFAS